MAIGPQALREGYGVFLFEDNLFPFSLRPFENGRYRLLETCYVATIIHGEALIGVGW